MKRTFEMTESEYNMKLAIEKWYIEWKGEGRDFIETTLIEVATAACNNQIELSR